MSGTKDMLCVSCGKRKAYPDGFPNRAFAECWECAWNEHVRTKHPEVVRRIKRAARKRARRIAEHEVAEAMFATERAQVLGGPASSSDSASPTQEVTP